MHILCTYLIAIRSRSSDKFHPLRLRLRQHIRIRIRRTFAAHSPSTLHHFVFARRKINNYFLPKKRTVENALSHHTIAFACALPWHVHCLGMCIAFARCDVQISCLSPPFNLDWKLTQAY
jgi:hypothetical protein